MVTLATHLAQFDSGTLASRAPLSFQAIPTGRYVSWKWASRSVSGVYNKHPSLRCDHRFALRTTFITHVTPHYTVVPRKFCMQLCWCLLFSPLLASWRVYMHLLISSIWIFADFGPDREPPPLTPPNGGFLFCGFFWLRLLHAASHFLFSYFLVAVGCITPCPCSTTYPYLLGTETSLFW